MRSQLIGEAHTQNHNAYWQAITEKAPMVAFGGEDKTLVRFHNVPGHPLNGQGFYGRAWYVRNQAVLSKE